jgi:hypothetical protein
MKEVVTSIAMFLASAVDAKTPPACRDDAAVADGFIKKLPSIQRSAII